jgi:ubiquinone/menaquinone biosynthesis C-methylase UbiE
MFCRRNSGTEKVNRCADYVAHYEADAEHFDYFNNPDETVHVYEILFRKFLKKLVGKPKTLLDLGSGSGWTRELPHQSIFFVDLSRKNLLALKVNSTGAILADACSLPFKTESLSVVIASEILEHLNSPESAAKEIVRVLEKGGKAIVSTPYKEKIRYALCIHCNQVTPMNAHLHSFDSNSLLSLFTAAKKKRFLFGSKLLVLLRAPRLFYRLPLMIWRLIDAPLTKLLDKAQHIVVVLEK